MGISINNPCTEDWSKMTATQKGAFCQKCSKEVVDFTNKSAIEIKSILEQNGSSHTMLCGRIKNAQIEEFNDTFFYWESEQDTFRAIWMISLISVFGLTLFSCQNTMSREIVHQMNVSGTEMIEQEIIEEQSDSLPMEAEATTSLEDTLNESREVAQVKLLEIPSVPNTPETLSVEICTVLMGDIVYGNVYYPPESERMSDDFFRAAVNHEVPIVNPLFEQERVVSNRRTAITSGNEGLKAYIAPLPIEEESRLYLSLEESLTLEISIRNIETGVTSYSGAKYFIKGVHKVDLQLYELSKGSYSLEVYTNTIRKILEFIR